MEIFSLYNITKCDDLNLASCLSMWHLYIYEGQVMVRSFVRAEFRCFLPSIHSVRFGQLLRCAHKCTLKGRACLFN